jgi:hypothetical protein
MKNYAQIENQTVINLIVVDENNVPDWVTAPTYIESDVAEIGDTYENGEFIPYVQPPQTAEQNKQTAITYLQETDWTSVADVGNPEMSNPYLVNQSEFIAWRSQVRAIAVNPIAGDNVFTPKPQEQWSN